MKWIEFEEFKHFLDKLEEGIYADTLISTEVMEMEWCRGGNQVVFLGTKQEAEYYNDHCRRLSPPSDWDERRNTPKYSTDTTRAFEIVAKLREKGFHVNITQFTHSDSWRCDFIHTEDYGTCSEYGVAETLPLAICKAALLVTTMKEHNGFHN